MTLVRRVGLVVPVLWLGFVLAISFMEAWLKFRAEGVTLATGLAIGSLVFFALNKVELFFLVALGWATYKIHGFGVWKKGTYIPILLLCILLLQTTYVLPVLDHRAQVIIAGGEPTSSYLHFFYIFLEVVKVVALILLSHSNLMRYTAQQE